MDLKCVLVVCIAYAEAPIWEAWKDFAKRLSEGCEYKEAYVVSNYRYTRGHPILKPGTPSALVRTGILVEGTVRYYGEDAKGVMQ